jgi:hypothetical protein
LDNETNGSTDKPKNYARVYKSIKHEIELALKSNNERDEPNGRYAQRKLFLMVFFGDLFFLKYKIERISSLKEKHIQAVFSYWDECGVPLAELDRRFIVMDVFCGWLGKSGMASRCAISFKESCGE